MRQFRQTLGEAHATVTSLEAALRDELGPGTEVDTHIEPAFPEESDATDVSPEELAAIVASAREATRKRPAIQGIHKVRARRSPCGLTVTLHCRFAPDATLEAVHAEVDDFEQDLLRRLGNARRVVVHAEPMRA